ncbi:MAG: ABC transporter permease, partial [Candidatus Acidiferrum sp.]
MSTQNLVARAQKTFKEQPWRLYGSQISVLVRNEVRRNLFTRRRIWVYLLALIPVLILIAHNIFSTYHNDPMSMEDETEVLAGIVQLYYFRLGIFFACMGIFTWLFRGEIVERTLHYQFLVPVRKEVLVVGKFLAGAIISILLFEAAVLACFFLTYSRFGSAGRSYIFD